MSKGITYLWGRSHLYKWQQVFHPFPTQPLICSDSCILGMKSESQDPKRTVSYNDRVRKGLIVDLDRTRPADQCQLVSRVELWYRSRFKPLF